MAQASCIAVLTGDLVGSSRFDDAQFDATRAHVAGCAAAMQDSPGADPIGFEFFHGILGSSRWAVPVMRCGRPC